MVACLAGSRAGVRLVRLAVSARRTKAAAGALPAVGELAIVDDTAAHARNRHVVVSTGS